MYAVFAAVVWLHRRRFGLLTTTKKWFKVADPTDSTTT